DLVALFDTCIDPDPRGQPQALEFPRLREERARVFRVEADFDRVPEQVASCHKGLSAGDSQLLADEVDACDELGDGMLDLDACVQLEEVKVAPVEQELGGSG